MRQILKELGESANVPRFFFPLFIAFFKVVFCQAEKTRTTKFQQSHQFHPENWCLDFTYRYPYKNEDKRIFDVFFLPPPRNKSRARPCQRVWVNNSCFKAENLTKKLTRSRWNVFLYFVCIVFFFWWNRKLFNRKFFFPSCPSFSDFLWGFI